MPRGPLPVQAAQYGKVRSLRMPVAGLRLTQARSSWHAPRRLNCGGHPFSIIRRTSSGNSAFTSGNSAASTPAMATNSGNSKP